MNKQKLLEMLQHELLYYEKRLNNLDYEDDLEYGVSIGYDVARQRMQGILSLAEKLN